MSQQQLDLALEAEKGLEPDWALQLSSLLNFALDHHYDTAARLLRGLRRGELIVAPNVSQYRVDL